MSETPITDHQIESGAEQYRQYPDVHYSGTIDLKAEDAINQSLFDQMRDDARSEAQRLAASSRFESPEMQHVPEFMAIDYISAYGKSTINMRQMELGEAAPVNNVVSLDQARKNKIAREARHDDMPAAA